jgi:hypothetical protein
MKLLGRKIFCNTMQKVNKKTNCCKYNPYLYSIVMVKLCKKKSSANTTIVFTQFYDYNRVYIRTILTTITFLIYLSHHITEYFTTWQFYLYFIMSEPRIWKFCKIFYKILKFGGFSSHISLFIVLKTLHCTPWGWSQKEIETCRC